MCLLSPHAVLCVWWIRFYGTPFTTLLAQHQLGAMPAERLALVREGVRELCMAYGQMVMADGLFQADPHPGNLLLEADGRASAPPLPSAPSLPTLLPWIEWSLI